MRLKIEFKLLDYPENPTLEEIACVCELADVLNLKTAPTSTLDDLIEQINSKILNENLPTWAKGYNSETKICSDNENEI